MHTPPEHELCLLSLGAGLPPLSLCVLSPRAHSESNCSATPSASAGDATGGRSSGGASRTLCHLLQKNPGLVADCRVLELGCGTAAAGLFSARTAADVVLSDGDATSLLLARASHKANAGAARVRFTPLAWGESGSRAVAPSGGPALADVLFAGCVPTSAPLLVLCADLLYYSEGTAALVSTLSELLLCSGGLCLCAFSPRHADWQAVLCGAAEARQLQVWQLPVAAVVPPEALQEGWFASTRLLLIWHAAAQPPRLEGGDSERLRRLLAAPGGRERGDWAALAGERGSSGSDSG
jgi:predicted nicotinamide N-methyase